MERKQNPLVTYNKSFLGFAARLSEEEATSIAQRPGVVFVFPERVLKLQTTRSKVIGARYYGSMGTSMDEHGHGTHVASIAAGMPVWGASYNGLAKGIARGGWPCSRIAMYRVCDANGDCRDSHILKAFDDAIFDGVDVLSLSIGGDPYRDDVVTDSLYIGAFHAVEKGIVVVAGAGNSGPTPMTVENAAPWMVTVGATTMDRDFEAGVVLAGGNNKVKGGGINFSGLNKLPVYQLVDGRSASNQTNVTNARYEINCIPSSLDDGKIKDKIVLCENNYRTIEKYDLLKNQGAAGMIVIDKDERQLSTDYVPGKQQPIFNIISGTSMSCPHVSGLAAMLKSWHPTWSPSAIRSAIMTTAIQTNNLHVPITTNNESRATPYDIGAGEISLFGPLSPGLVYETDTADYVQFLCNLGYNTSVIKTMSATIPNNFTCPTNSSPDLITYMNYPSIAVSGLKVNGSRAVKRTVTNVGEEYSTYKATVKTPVGMQVQVVPELLRFTKKVKTLSFQLIFKLTKTSKEPLFGSITLSTGKYNVRSPFVISAA
ncbi:co(2)-response secreted protease [Phtheirospermum japonicum]|uniref:Co(2)-response secreted protease n=1 Tax=Phtheirospermum japonicum TaxID=374723 RepID=A0A830BCC1_9LAMI|nr:co(2)-response secreted protease [Phtheirospermum japonicum]